MYAILIKQFFIIFGLLNNAFFQNRNYGANNFFEFFAFQFADLFCHYRSICRKNLSRTRVTRLSKQTAFQIAVRNLNGLRIGVRLARNLTQNPIAASRVRQNNRRTQFRAGQIGKRKAD